MRTKGQWLAVVLVGLAVAGVAVFAVVGRSLAFSSQRTGAVAAGSTDATASEAAATSGADASTAAPSSVASSPSATGTSAASTTTTAVDSTKAVHPALVYADWDGGAGVVEASGFVSDVVEAGGTCTLTLTQGAAQVQASSSAEPDATTTNCGRITVPGAQLAAGTWQAVLTYRSPTSHGTAAAMNVSVPAS